MDADGSGAIDAEELHAAFKVRPILISDRILTVPDLLNAIVAGA